MIKTILNVGVFSLALLMFSCNNETTNSETMETDTIPGFNLSNLDTSYKPCDDFYSYATKGWQKNNPLPKTEGRWGTFSILNEQNEDKVKEIIHEVAKSNAKQGAIEQQIGDLYKSAMDSAEIEKRGLKPLKPYFEAIDNLKSADDFPAFFAQNKLNGFGNPLALYATVDEKNSTHNIAYFAQSGLSLPDKDYYLKNDERYVKIQEAYKKHLKNMFELMGNDTTKAAEKATHVYDIEKQMASFSMARVDQRQPEKTYNKISVDELVKLTNGFDWNAYFKTLNITVDTLVMMQPDFFKQTSELFKSVTLDNWKDYFKYHLLIQFASWLPDTFAVESFNFYSGTLNGVTERKPREKRAVKFVNAYLSQPVGHLFVKKYFSESSKKAVEAIIEDLRSVYIERVQQLDWMDDTTKEKAVEKLKAFTYKIGYPEKWKDYSSVKITPDNIVENIIALSHYATEYNLNKIGKPVDKTEWGMPPQMVNAYYEPTRNEVVFPAGILQPPFYSIDADDAINYGGIGAVIGHEFTHGFDDQGSKYDKDGNINPWWTEQSKEKFNQKTKLIVEQFNAFEPFEGIHVQGELTQGENIADLGGLTLSYYALKKHYEKVGKGKTIAGFTPEQRFFLGWAQVWASNVREQTAKQLITIDPHSPSQYRVNGPMSNLKEFKEAWHCKDGDNMVRPDSVKVVIW